MNMDPRYVASEGLLHADRCTAEYIGRAAHRADAVCFRASRAAVARAPLAIPRTFYYETLIMATSPTAKTSALSVPVRLNTQTTPTSHRAAGAPLRHDATVRLPHNQSQSPLLESMDTEDVLMATATDALPVERPASINFLSTRRLTEHLQSIIDRPQVGRSTDKHNCEHGIAVGFLLDKAEPKRATWGPKVPSCALSCRSNGASEAEVPRMEVKHWTQRTMSGIVAGEESDKEEEEEKAEETRAKDQETTRPAIVHEDLHQLVNSVAYVGKTGRVVARQRKWLKCQRYGAGDVVGCGILFDTNTFFFTLNGSLVGMLAAADVQNLDTFEEGTDSEEDESGVGSLAEDNEDEKDGLVDDNGMWIPPGGCNDVDMEETGGCSRVKHVLYPCVSLHGAGECVRAIYEAEDFLFDLPEFERQIQKERQEALLADRERLRKTDVACESDWSDHKTDTVVNDLLQDFFLHNGYESAYKALKATLEPMRRQRLSPDGMDVVDNNEVEASTVSSVRDAKKGVQAKMSEREDAQSGLHIEMKKAMCESLGLRHEVREHIRCCRTAQALTVIEQQALVAARTDRRSRQWRKLIQSCRILCVIDVLTRKGEAKVATISSKASNSAPRMLTTEEGECNGWNAEVAIEFARQMFGSFSEVATNGKRKRLERSNGVRKQCDDSHDVALAMSLLLYGQRDSIPKSSRARRFLMPEFRESVAEQLNELLLMSNDDAKTAPRASALEKYMADHEKLRKECLNRGCRVYPESSGDSVSKNMLRRRRASVSSTLDKFSSSSSEQDDHSAGDDNDDDDDDDDE
ncbi:unnamed protein product [Hyaloperonospora brassicae]|uniref:LisH domain-containing protein n=1 Tax=Hyaloperonospora brassicae TaxID=162125 RepID=A0AAV0TB54_HYABA|nr:unnamed protein product [Hyaloperonospora brassicae]